MNRPAVENELYYGDNLTVMRDKIANESIDLIYLDPPFNSKKNYTLIYKTANGLSVAEQAEAFCDSWKLRNGVFNFFKELKLEFQNENTGFISKKTKLFFIFLIEKLKIDYGLIAYLSFIAMRLIELKRVLKPTKRNILSYNS